MEKPIRVKFTNLQKTLYPSFGIKKHEVVEYYVRTGPLMANFLVDRPISMYRFPDGIHREGFFEKDAPRGTPSWVRTFRRYSETANRTVDYVVCNDLETLAWLANLAALEINITLSRTAAYEKPDLVFFDIDPEPPADFDNAIEVAQLLKAKLDLLGLVCYVKTSGKKGLHVVLPIVQDYTFKETRAFVHQMGRFLAREGDFVVSEFSQTKSPGTVFVDYMQNTTGRTMICPYSLRAEEHATVSTPLEWREIEKGLKPEDFNISSVPQRKIWPWKGLFEHSQKLEFE